MWLTLEQVEYLQAVKDSGSITQAALTLGKAKSALYYSIKRLEEEVGFQLVHTQKHRGRLTPKGERFLERASPLLNHLEQLKDETHQIATGVELKISLSATAMIPMSVITGPIREIQQEYPNTEIVFHREILSGEKLLLQQVVDVAICESERKLSDELEYLPLGHNPLSLVIASGHPILKLENPSMNDLFAQPQIIQRATISRKDDVGGIFKQSKQWTVSDLAAKKSLILEGLGWGRLPRHMIKEELKAKRLVALENLEPPVQLPIYLVRRVGSKPGRVLNEVWNRLKKIKLN